MNDKVYEILRRSMSNISQNYCDEYVEENADFRAKSGMSTKIVRSTNGNCCKWCSSIAGIYDYPAPKDVYRRHDNCDCTVTFVSKKGAVDVWTKKNLKQLDFEDRLKKLAENEVTIPNVFEDVKQEYFKDASRDKGEFIIEDGVELGREKSAIENAELLNELFGHEIIVQKTKDAEGVPNPDYLWRGKMWEQKKMDPPGSENAIDIAVRTAYRQIRNNPGGIVLDVSDVDLPLNTIYKMIAKRIGRRRYDDSIDVILIDNNTLISILRHKKR